MLIVNRLIISTLSIIELFSRFVKRGKKIFCRENEFADQNSFSHYLCYVDIEFRSVPKPSPRGEGVTAKP